MLIFMVVSFHSMFVDGKNLNYFSSFNLKGYGFGVESLMKDYVTLIEDPKANLPNQFTGKICYG